VVGEGKLCGNGKDGSATFFSGGDGDGIAIVFTFDDEGEVEGCFDGGVTA